MIIKIVNEEGTQYKETHHQLYIHSYQEYIKRFPERQERNSSEGESDIVSPEAVLVYNYIDGGGGHLHIYKGTDVYLMNNDGKTVDRYCFH
jgi:hypothetical protein